MFKLNEKLESDLVYLSTLKLSQLFLLPDSDNPWFVLVPKVENIKEFHHLSQNEQEELLKEINLVSTFLEQEFSPDKLNIGSLGNMVPQLHIHIIARFKGDKAWPGAIWGAKAGKDLEVIENWRKLALEKI